MALCHLVLSSDMIILRYFNGSMAASVLKLILYEIEWWQQTATTITVVVVVVMIMVGLVVT